MEQINTGHWPFDGSITEDVQIEDLTPETLAYASDRHIFLNGTERISGVMHYVWQAAEGTDFALIDEFISYATINKIPTCVSHDKRPPSLNADAVVQEQWVPPAGIVRGIVPPYEIDFKITPSADGLNPDIAFKGRGMSRSASVEMLMQLEDDQMQFGLEALNKYLDEGVRPAVLTGRVSCADENPSVVPSVAETGDVTQEMWDSLQGEGIPIPLRTVDGYAVEPKPASTLAREAEELAFHKKQWERMQTPMQRLRMFLDPENKFSEKAYAKLLSDISAPPKKPHHTNINCALLEFAKQYGIEYEGAKPIDGVQHHIFNAPAYSVYRAEDVTTLREVLALRG